MEPSPLHPLVADSACRIILGGITGNTWTLWLVQGQCAPAVVCVLPASGPLGQPVKKADSRVQCQPAESRSPRSNASISYVPVWGIWEAWWWQWSPGKVRTTRPPVRLKLMTAESDSTWAHLVFSESFLKTLRKHDDVIGWYVTLIFFLRHRPFIFHFYWSIVALNIVLVSAV